MNSASKSTKSTKSLASGMLLKSGRSFGRWWKNEAASWKAAKTTGEALPRRSKAAIASVGLAAVSFFIWPLLALLTSVAALGLGALGFLRATSPRIRGGVMSLAGIGLAVFAFGVAVLRLIF